MWVDGNKSSARNRKMADIVSTSGSSVLVTMARHALHRPRYSFIGITALQVAQCYFLSPFPYKNMYTGAFAFLSAYPRLGAFLGNIYSAFYLNRIRPVESPLGQTNWRPGQKVCLFIGNRSFPEIRDRRFVAIKSIHLFFPGRPN